MTIEAVARDAGVSQSTVSRVLNQPGLVRASTRDAVYSALRKHNYVPPASNRTEIDRTSTFALAVHDVRLPVVAEVIREIETQLANTHYDLLVINLRGSRDVAGFFRKNDHLRRKIDALIAFSVELNDEGAEYFHSVGLPVVLMQARCTSAKSISTNDFLGGHDATAFLLDRGYQRIAFVGWHPEDHRVRARFGGYRSALEQRGISFETRMAAFASLSAAGGYEATNALLQGFDADAVFFACDTMAVGGYRCFRSRGIAVPESIGAVGFDNLEVAEAMGLTSMQQFFDVKAKMAIHHLVARLAEGGAPLEEIDMDEISITPRIVIRESTR
ncbi:MAG: LacI family transcriptional regulator [Spirochaetaceae bacterium]|nr:MAG: LacI family transcriptional regulator [Spirochaetaceae bacterium]